MSQALLDALRRDLAAELRGETPIRLHTYAVTPSKKIDGSSEETYGHMTGLPWTPAMERRVSHSDWWSIDELAHRSLKEIGDMCRSRHATDLHRSPGRSTSLCERIVSGLCEFGHPLAQIAWREGLDEQHVIDLATKALQHASKWRHQRLHQYMRTARETERDTVVQCPQCHGQIVVLRRRRPAA